jgi:heme exporter protein A
MRYGSGCEPIGPAPVSLSTPTASPAGAPLIGARALACRRGERLLFDGLDFALRPGQLIWLRGANGRGKTSLLRLLAGLAPPAGGEITRGVAGFVYIAHANALKDDLSALENLQFLARLHGDAADAAGCTEALRRFGMAGRRNAPVRTLSQGQRRRVALARLVLAAPGTLWILDEPYDALDTEACATLDGLLAGHTRGGGAVVLTSHLPLALAEPSPTVLQLDAAAIRPVVQ